MIEVIHSKNAPAAIGPYSQATAANGFVFVSGQLPIDMETGELIKSPAEAADASLKNVAAILAEKGLSMANVVKITIFLSDMDDFAAVNEVYSQHFSEPFPARACVAVKQLPRDAVLEIEAIAAL